MAKENPTIPGRCATFATCSMARSSSALDMSASDAKTRPGTRMPPVRRISHRTSERRLASDIEIHGRFVPVAGAAYVQTVIRDGLDRGAVLLERAAAAQRRIDLPRLARELCRHRLRHEAARVEEEQDLREPVHE